MAEKHLTMLALSAVAAISAVLISLTSSSPQPVSTLRIGYAIERPYAYLNSHGELTGAYIETAEKIAERMETENVEWVQIRFDKLLTSLKQGHIDLIGSGMYLTEERDKDFDFSHPFLKVDSAIIIDKSETLIPDIQDEPAMTIAVQAGSVEARRLQSAAWINALPVPYPQTGIEALESGISDGLYLSKPTLKTIQRQNRGQYEIVPESCLVGNFRELGIGYVFNDDDDELRRKWNQASADWIGSQEHIRIVSRFGFSEHNLP